MPVTTAKSIVPSLAAIRVRKRMSQAELAAAVGITKMMISNYESGRNNPTSARIFELARVLKCKVDDLR